MANLRSSIKRARQNIKRRARNRAVMSRSRTAVSKATRLVATGDKDEARQAVIEAISEVDKAASKGVIHRNKAARRKSRLMAKLNSME
ncbi:MAG: 30S ribosomal protein S20 [Chloroflexi bacterium]|nr:30S ribosomal protein S20 [Chloroflexota bacterium]